MTRLVDKLQITGLRVSTVIGVRGWERQLRQPLMIDLGFSIDASAATTSDAIDDALDYGAVARRVTELTEASSFQLIESLAESIATMVLAEFAPASVTVKVAKPGAVPQAQGVSIEIERS
jgi:dihydroneopterin aldolase